MTSIIPRSLITAAVLAISATATTSAFAYGTSTREIDRREARQEDRIRDGIRDGSITRSEARVLIEEQRRIQQLESRAKADGRIDPREREQIRRAQDEASRHIKQERSDSERRGSRFWWR